MKRLAALATLLVALPLLTSSAHAQFGGRTSYAEAFVADIRDRDVPIFVTTLQLEDWQRPIIDALVQDYTANFNAGVEALKQQMTKAKGQTDRPADVEAILKPIDDWNVEKARLYTKFLDDVKSQLSEPQVERWPKFERAMRRERLLDQGELSGESINLFGILHDVNPPRELNENIEPVLDTYEVALDEALKARTARMEELMPAMKSAMSNMDFENGLKLQERIMAARVRVREIQDQAIVDITKSLGDEWGPKFKEIAMRRAYRDAFVPDPVMHQYEAALQLTDLTPEQRGAIEAAKVNFTRELDQLSNDLVEAIRAEEPKAPRNRFQNAQLRGAPPTPGQHTASQAEAEKLKRRRGEIDENYRSQLMAILSPEQSAGLPGAGKLDAKAGDKATLSPGARHTEGLSGGGKPDRGAARGAGAAKSPEAAPGEGGSKNSAKALPTKTAD